MNYKVPTLLHVSLFCGIVSLSVILSCQKKEDKPASDVTVKDQPYFHKGVGAPIDSATANRYKRNLTQKLSKSKATVNTTTAYYLPAAVLREIISRDNNIGVLFYFGKDSVGNVHLVPIGIDNRDYVMVTATVVTTAGPVSWKVAKQWRDSFKQQYPDGSTPWGYFWGSIAVQRLLDQGTEEVRISLGLNDEGTQQIMVSNAKDPSPTFEEDRMRTCPPYCGTEDEIN